MKKYSKTHKYEEKDFVNVDDPAGLDCSVLPSRTAQEFREEVDINTIAERYKLTGELPQDVPMILQGDFEEVHDFQSAMNLVVAGRESFDAMPAAIRAEFRNDPQEFLEFVSKPENFDRAVSLGLVRPEVAAARAAAAEATRQAELDAAVRDAMARREASPGLEGGVPKSS